MSKWPIHRRTANGMNLYRIEAEDRFVELQRLGAGWLIYRVVGAPYPERVRIMEMIDGHAGTFLPEDEAVFEAAFAEASAGSTGGR
jgi:hypothetical protein